MSSKYTTILGDTWDIIAKKVYSDEKAFSVIIDANPKYIDTLVFSDGVTLDIPDSPYTESTEVLSDQARWREIMNNG